MASDAVGNWMRQAASDLRLAELASAHALYDGACYHAQQCAEKALKAVLIHVDEAAPWGHAVHELALRINTLFDTSVFTDDDIDDFKVLAQFVASARYPNESGAPTALITRRQAEDAVVAARRTLERCPGLIADEGSGR